MQLFSIRSIQSSEIYFICNSKGILQVVKYGAKSQFKTLNQTKILPPDQVRGFMYIL